MPLVDASKEICNVRYIKVQVITHFQPSLDKLERLSSNWTIVGLIPAFGEALSKK